VSVKALTSECIRISSGFKPVYCTNSVLASSSSRCRDSQTIRGVKTMSQTEGTCEILSVMSCINSPIWRRAQLGKKDLKISFRSVDFFDAASSVMVAWTMKIITRHTATSCFASGSLFDAQSAECVRYSFSSACYRANTLSNSSVPIRV
jgi:hypothetical protein